MKARLGILLLAMVAVGCAQPQGRGLADDDALYKIPAMKTAAQQKNETAIPDLVAALDDDDDVQNVYANFEVSEDVMKKLTAA